ncbi:MAG: MBL fold metallo-hydrolase, partial [Ruminococcus sp.]|nr:MBL fold metallo-hydrolase [Ruminococcus sp.]
KRWLLSGCAHNGILNILDRYKALFGSEPDYVVSGFHMMKRDAEHTEEEKAVIIQTAKELSQMKTIFYSGHCTGIPAFELMKEIMGDKLIALHSGEQIL